MKKFLENSIHQAIKACFFFLGKLPKRSYLFLKVFMENSIVIIHVQFLST